MRKVESALGIGSLLLLAMLPLIEVILRVFGTGLLGLDDYLTHFVLITGYIGGIVAAREKRHLSIGGGEIVPRFARRYTTTIASFISVTFMVALTWSALNLLVLGFGLSDRIGIAPAWLFILVIPISYVAMGVHFMRSAKKRTIRMLIGIGGLLAGTLLAYSTIHDLIFFLLPEPPLVLDTLFFAWERVLSIVAIPLVIVLILSAFAGAPLFIVLGGIAFLLFARVGGALAVVPNEGYTMLTGGAIPTIALFTFTGYLLSESRAADRLVEMFRSLFGWMPGGMIMTAVIALAFFTSFTGVSGVTILALGGLLFPILHRGSQYSERFSTGLITSSSNIGLLFAPSLAIIVYGTVTQVRIDHLFLAGIVPGFLIITIFCIIGIIVSVRNKTPLHHFDLHKLFDALRNGWIELLLPVIIIVAFLGGPHWIVTVASVGAITAMILYRKNWRRLALIPVLLLVFLTKPTMIEISALAALYTFVVEVIIYREIKPRDLPSVILKCITIVGGVLVILASARALSFYIIDTQLPITLQQWVQQNIHSRFLFLLALNLTLLITGCFMDIFSAILIVAPLVIPLGSIYGIDPIHLGIIFLSNLGVGFITPPVGIDLFLSAYRFEKPLIFIYRSVVPFFITQVLIVLIITYFPPLSTSLLNLVR